jgi:hypothetical protein
VVVAVGFATCCIGFLLMVTPYVGQVVLLPLHVAYRALGPEFLAQFGPEFEKLLLTTLLAPWPRAGDLDPAVAAAAVSAG